MAGILTSMSTLKTAVSMGVAVVAIGFGVYETQQCSRADAAAAERREESDRLRTRLNATEALAARLEKRAAQAEEQRAALERNTRGLFSNKTVSGAGLSLNSSAGAGRSPEGELSLQATPATTDPEQARQQLRNLNRPGVRTTYSPFYRKLGLTTEGSNRFDELVPDNTERGSALFKKAAAQSSARDRESLQTVAEVVQDQSRASLGSLVSGAFGDKIGGEFHRFQETMALRPVTNQLASALFYTETPLTAALAEQLVDIMAQNARSAEGKVNPAETDKSSVRTAARAVRRGRPNRWSGRWQEFTCVAATDFRG